MTKKAWLITAHSIIIIAILIVAVLLVRNRDTGNVSVSEYASYEITYADGTSKMSESNDLGTINRGDTVTAHLYLPEKPIMDNAVLTFYIYHSVTEVRYGEKLLDSYGQEIDAKGNMVGKHFFLVPVPAEAWGNEITITMKATENNAFNRIESLSVYPAPRSYEYFMAMDYTGSIVGLMIFLQSVLGLLFMLMHFYFLKLSRNGLYICLMGIISSVWMLTRIGVQHLFGFNGYFMTQMEFISGFTICIPLLLWAYESEVRNTRMKKLLRLAIVINCVSFVASTVLHVTNILHYNSVAFVFEIQIFLSGILVFVFSWKRRNTESESVKAFFNGMLVLLSTGLFELLSINVDRYLFPMIELDIPSVFPLGLLFFFISMLRSYYIGIKDRNTKATISEMQADALNKIFNSTPAGIGCVSYEDNFPILQANDMFFEIYGYTKEEAAKVGYDNLFYPLDKSEQEKLLKVQRELRETISPVTREIELSVNAVDGHKVDIMAIYHFLGRKDGRIVANVIDITKQKRLVDEIRINEERYRLALLQSGKYFAYFDVPTRVLHMSKELAEHFKLATDVENMPYNPLIEQFIEPVSIQRHHNLFERIVAGETSGEAILSLHMPLTPDVTIWFKMSFNTIFDAGGMPVSSIIAFEDFTKQRQSEIAAKWKLPSLVALPETEYVIEEYNFTTGNLLSQRGELFMHTPEFLTNYDDITEFALEHFIFDDDITTYRDFLNRQRLLALYNSGVSEDSVEYRSLQKGSVPRWTKTSVQMITDSYSGEVMAQLFHRDIDREKSGEMALRLDLDKLKKELDNSRIKVMISQMQPHFLYNALSAIQTIVKTDPDYAYRLIYDFTVHLRSSIKALSSDVPIPFTDELKNIKAYLNIERMRFGDELRVVYDITCDDFNVLPLSIQPLTENSARHGIFQKGEDGGTVTVRTYKTDTAYIIEVEDDGVGFDVDKVLQEESDSIGLKNLIFRLKNLQNANVKIESHIGIGTKVTVSIPKSD